MNIRIEQKADELAQYLFNAINSNKIATSKTVILAGHYMLSWQNGVFADHLPKSIESVDDKALDNNDFLLYTLTTWLASCKLIPEFKGLKLLTLANDWQLMGAPKNTKLRGEWEKEKHCFLKRYYNEAIGLPAILNQLMLTFENAESEVLEKNSTDQWVFSESALRERMVKNAHADTFSNLPACEVQTTGSAKRVVLNNPDLAEFVGGNEFVLVHNNSTNCAGEVVELVNELAERGYDHFICLHPMSCKNYVNTGVLTAKELYPITKNLNVTNISIPVDINIKSIYINRL